MKVKINICNCFSKMTKIPSIILVGDKGIGKSTLIKEIVSGRNVSKRISIKYTESKFIKINNKVYGNSFIKRVFKCFAYDETEAVIVANRRIPSSINSIPKWYEKIKKNNPNIDVSLVLINDFEISESKIMYNIYHFCSTNKINIIRI